MLNKKTQFKEVPAKQTLKENNLKRVSQLFCFYSDVEYMSIRFASVQICILG